jgi:hypothetical protein
VQAYRFPVKYNDWTVGSFKATGPVTPGPLGAAMTRFAANPQDEAAAAEIGKVPTEVGKTRTTCVATMLRGGHASNALPQTATATLSCRIFPDTSVDDVKATLQQVAGKNVQVSFLGSTPPAGASPLRKDVLAALTKAAHARYPDLPVVPGMVPWATDGAVYRAAGIPHHDVSGSFIKAEATAQPRSQRASAGQIVLRRADARYDTAEGTCGQAQDDACSCCPRSADSSEPARQRWRYAGAIWNSTP